MYNMFLSMFIIIACFCFFLVTFILLTFIYMNNYYHAMLFDDIIQGRR